MLLGDLQWDLLLLLLRSGRSTFRDILALTRLASPTDLTKATRLLAAQRQTTPLTPRGATLRRFGSRGSGLLRSRPLLHGVGEKSGAAVVGGGFRGEGVVCLGSLTHHARGPGVPRCFQSTQKQVEQAVHISTL